MTGCAVVLDDFALAALPGLDRELSAAGASVSRCFDRLPSPAMVRRQPPGRVVVVVGGADLAGLRQRLELATATLGAPVIAALPEGADPTPALRGPGVVDLVPAGARRAAERILLMSRVPIVTAGRRAQAGAAAAAAPGAEGLGGTPRPGSAGPAAGRGARDGAPPPAAPTTGTGPGSARTAPTATDAPRAAPPQRLVAVAGSTGGAWVAAGLLAALRGREVTAAVLAQHMDAEFLAFFADWLASVTPWAVTVVEEPVALEAGRLYLAAGGRDLVIEPERALAAPASSRFVPSADRLLASAARAHGPRLRAVVLSGMGADGAEGLAEVARRGGRAVCQAPSSAVVPSMPESALRRTPGARVAAPEALAAVLAADDGAPAP